MSDQIKDLAKMDVEDLYKELGMKKRFAEVALLEGGKPNVDEGEVRDFKFDSPASANFIGDSLESLKKIGKQFFSEISEMAYGVVCNSASGSEAVKDLIGKGKKAIIAGLTALLISQLGIAAAVAAIVAAIVINLFFDAGGKVLCQNWKASLGTAA